MIMQVVLAGVVLAEVRIEERLVTADDPVVLERFLGDLVRPLRRGNVAPAGLMIRMDRAARYWLERQAGLSRYPIEIADRGGRLIDVYRSVPVEISDEWGQ